MHVPRRTSAAEEYHSPALPIVEEIVEAPNLSIFTERVTSQVWVVAASNDSCLSSGYILG